MKNTPMKDSMDTEGRLEQAGERWRVRFTRALSHPQEKVWRALTEPEHRAAWFPDTVVGEFVAGAKLRFEYPGGGFDGEVLAAERPALLELLWGDDVLRFELRADGDGTLLVFTDTFDELGKAARDTAGWHVCLDRLGAELRGAARGDDDPSWKDLNAVYVERFGPEAGTIGPPEGHPEA